MKKNINKIINSVLIIAMFCTLFYIPSVKAATTYIVNDDEVNIRSGPGTSYTKTRTINKGLELTVSGTYSTDDNTSGCSSGKWYKISSTEYICTTFVTVNVDGQTIDQYLRPWTSPEKSIKGGAVFIGNSYIAKGQYTSYLQKFNVNPNGSYSVNTHQYMANIMAPYSEANSSYNSYNNAGLLNQALVFTIPVFNNMPDITTLSGYTTQSWGTSTVTDTAFEAELNAQGFPESYKQKLRVLHTSYPNWKFEALLTGLDFYSTVYIQKGVGAVNYVSLSDGGASYAGQANWYVPSVDATAYFLDPRNSLEVTRIIQFEKLTFSSVYNEASVQLVLNGTFMQEYSILDNKRYAQIFVEAGREANINPIHIASRAKQESGVNGGKTTNGAEFTYKGVTYVGLYNFYNIGASDSEGSPALAGLVWASGGSTSVIVDENTYSSIASFLQASGYTINSNYISRFTVGNKVEDIQKYLSSVTVTIHSNNGAQLSGQTIIGTNMQIKITNGSETKTYMIVIYGDTSGDGVLDSGDLLKIKQHLLGTILSGSYSKAADTNKDGIIDSGDLLALQRHLLGIASINQ